MRGKYRRFWLCLHRSALDGCDLPCAQLAGVDEQYLTPTIPVLSPLTVAGDEPEAGRYLRGIEELAGQCHHAIHQVGPRSDSSV